jgi:signal transduction histidine kinase
MFSSISHELRTPINAFLNANEMIKFCLDKLRTSIGKSGKNEVTKVQKMIEIINKNTNIATVSSNLLLNLTEDILDFAKIEAGIFMVNSSKFFIQELTNDIKFIFDHQCKAKGIHFSIELEEQLVRARFNSDSGRIKQILINLISNAFKFTNQGSIKVDISLLTERDFERSQRFLKLIVQDTGIGISQQDQARLFKVFGMVHKHRDEFNCRGTGLGLTITQKLVELLGGQISIESEEDKGTKVTFTIKEVHPNPINHEDISVSVKPNYDFCDD